MKIKQATLINFQKHNNLSLDFNEDINIITGFSNAGKSCIRRALDWVLFASNISEKDIRKEGTKKTSVILILDNNIEIERVRSASINRYILRVNGEEKIFDSFGKEVPEEIQQLINLDLIRIDNDILNLNIAEQLALPFLLDKPASFRAKLFNKLTGNELLDSLFKKCNKNSLSYSKEIKVVEESIEDVEENLSINQKEYGKLKKKLDSVNKKYAVIKEKKEIYEELNNISNKLKNNNELTEKTKKDLEKIKTISQDKIADLKLKAGIYNKLKELNDKIKKINKNIEETKVKEIKNIDFKTLINKAETFEKLKTIKNNIFEINKKGKEAKEKLEKDKILYNELDKELKEIWDKLDVCPLCKQKHKEK